MIESQPYNHHSTCETLREELTRKIKLQRGIHDYYEDITRLWLTIQKTINVVVTAFITLIIFADFGLIEKLFPSYSGTKAMLTVGSISFLLFVINALADVFRLSTKHIEHLHAIQLYTSLLQDIRKAKSSGHPDKTELELLHQFNDRYMQISVSVLNVGGRKFERAQRVYLRRRARRKAIQDKPFAKWSTINKNASKIDP